MMKHCSMLDWKVHVHVCECICMRVCYSCLDSEMLLVVAGDEYKWDDSSEAALWSLVEKYRRELYDQKNGFTRNEYLDKISRELHMYVHFVSVCTCMCATSTIFTEADLYFSEPILGHLITRRQVDNKIRHIERRYKNRNDKQQKSGAGNLSPWGLEDRVAAVIGDRPTVHVETVSSMRKDNSKGWFSCDLFLGGGG